MRHKNLRVTIHVEHSGLGDMAFEQDTNYYGDSPTDDRVAISNLLENVTTAVRNAYKLEQK